MPYRLAKSPYIKLYAIKAKIVLKIWSGKRGSNPRPPPWQGGALSTELFPQALFYDSKKKVKSQYKNIKIQKYFFQRKF